MIRRLLFAALLTAGTFSILPAATLTFLGSGGSIPDYDGTTLTPGVFTSDIVVPNSVALQASGNNVTVTLLGLAHDYSGDLTATLTYIGGVTISRDIFNRIGVVNSSDPGFSSKFGDLITNYAFRSSFGNDLWGVAGSLGDGDFIPGDNYWTSGAGSGVVNDLSSAFNGQSAAAIWRLIITDNSPGDEGELSGWQLDLEVADRTNVPEPTSIAMITLGASALVLIRGRRFLTGA